MRSALLSCVALVGSIAASAIACSTFSDAENETPQPTVDAGPDVTTGGGGITCKPVIVDPQSVDPACGDILSDPKNCGACGHGCVDTTCVAGHCTAEKVGDPVGLIAIDGSTLYAQQNLDLVRADLTKRPYVFEQYIAGITDVKRMEVFGGELYVSTGAGQSIINLATKTPRDNEQVALLSNKNGVFYPGTPAYYEYAADSMTQALSRIESANKVLTKTAPKFDPVAHAGADIFWTEFLASGAVIHGPWDSDPSQPIARIGSGGPPIEALFAENGTVYFVANGHLVRADRNGTADLAVETGVAVAFAVDGTDLYYVVRRESLETRYFLLRIDKCNGGRPLALYDVNVPLTDILLFEDDHITVKTANGFFRFRR